MLRLRSGNRLKVGEGVSGIKSGSSGTVVFKSHVSYNDGVDWYELFWRERVFAVWDSGL